MKIHALYFIARNLNLKFSYQAFWIWKLPNTCVEKVEREWIPCVVLVGSLTVWHNIWRRDSWENIRFRKQLKFLYDVRQVGFKSRCVRSIVRLENHFSLMGSTLFSQLYDNTSRGAGHWPLIQSSSWISHSQREMVFVRQWYDGLWLTLE